MVTLRQCCEWPKCTTIMLYGNDVDRPCRTRHLHIVARRMNGAPGPKTQNDQSYIKSATIMLYGNDVDRPFSGLVIYISLPTE